MSSSSKIGLTYHLTRLAISLKRKGHKIIALANYKEQIEGLGKELKEQHILLYRSNFLDKTNPYCLYKAKKTIETIVKKENIEIIHARGLRHLLPAYFASKQLPWKIAIIETEHTSAHLSSKWKRFVVPYLLNRYVDLELSISNVFGNDLISYGLNPSKVKTVHNAIDLEVFDCDQSRKYSRVSKLKFLQMSDPLIVQVANLYPWKGYEYSIGAFAKVNKRYPETRLLIVGDGPLRGKLESLVVRLKLTDHVEFAGLVPNRCIPYILSHSDIFILSSLHEVLPRSILEAMAAGKPVIAPHIGGIPEMVNEGVTGYLIPPKDLNSLASKILELLKNKNLAERMGKAGRKLIEQKFEINTIAEELEKIYQEVVEKD